MSTITEQSVVARTDSLAVTELDGEAVVLDIESGQYFGLNGVGARVFTMTEEPIAVATVIEHIASNYGVSSEQVQTDVLRFLERMQEHGLIELSKVSS